MRVSRQKQGSSKRRAAFFESLENRQLFNVLTVGPTESYHTIDFALSRANVGDTIQIDPGTYAGPSAPITIANLTINGSGKSGGGTVITPNTTLSNGAVIDASASGFVLSNVAINGAGSSITDGVLLEVPVTASTVGPKVTNVNVTNTYYTANPGANLGFGIAVQSGTAVISYVQVDHYQRAGIEVGPAINGANGQPIIVSGAKQSATISNSFVYGPVHFGDGVTSAPGANAVENGIVFIAGGFGSVLTTTVDGNETTSGLASGIAIVDAGNVSLNTVTSSHNDTGIYADAVLPGVYSTPQFGGSTNLTMTTVTATGNAYDGIDIFSGVAVATLSAVKSNANGQLGLWISDAISGTANFYTGTGLISVKGGDYSDNNINLSNSTNVEDDTVGTRTYGTRVQYSAAPKFYDTSHLDQDESNSSNVGFYAPNHGTTTNANFNLNGFFYAVIGDGGPTPPAAT